ncbi:MAG TPA: DUF4404 family protein [Candidatus Aquilonibacter sp.]|nr:DUF4404 family protein [Candidatus Aquilonibacter sp.]
MIEETIGELEAKIRGADSLGDVRKRDLIASLAKLKTEITALKESHDAARETQQSLKGSVEELRSSVAGFEQSHPKLVQLVNNISSTLANLGI